MRGAHTRCGSNIAATVRLSPMRACGSYTEEEDDDDDDDDEEMVVGSEKISRGGGYLKIKGGGYLKIKI